jgi:hypothetical protein
MEQGASVADLSDEERKKLEQGLKGEVVKDPKLGKPTQEKLDKILDKAKKKK